VLSVTAVNTFCTNWLVPRLGTFQVAHPSIAVRLDASARLVDFTREEFDIGIRAGKGKWPGLKAHLLFPVAFVAVCSPDFLKRAGRIDSAADVMKLPLLDSTDEVLWRRWFASAGIPDPHPITGPKMSVQTQQMVGSAAMAGQGIALVTPAFFEADLAAGRLIQVLPTVSCHEADHWLVYPENRGNLPKIRAFRDWILGEVAKDRAAKKASAPSLAVAG
jgi:LysR family transcriptional regulator, glycine cleavage system transcriptional activator